MRVWYFAALVLLTAGCGGGPVLPVNGVVTWDNEPMDGAAVTFFADGKTTMIGGTAKTGSDGKFVIVGGKGERGLVAGSYKVTVSKMKGGVSDEPTLAAVTEADIKNDLPAHYSDPNQTVLSFSVTGDGKPIEIKLSSKYKKKD